MSNKVAIIGGGNGGQAMAGHFGLLGHSVTLYNRTFSKVQRVSEQGGVILKEALAGFGPVSSVTDSIEDAIQDAQIIVVTTTADAHAHIAEAIGPHLRDGQVIVLCPGRTCGALEFRYTLERIGVRRRIYLAETQSLIYACRTDIPGESRVIGVKDRVLLAALPACDTQYVLDCMNGIYNCFYPAGNVLVTSMENIGTIFHPAVVLFNGASIERGQDFLFYNDMTPQIAGFLQKIDAERLDIGRALGISLVSAEEWISLAYSNIRGSSLCEKMRNNPAYYRIKAPAKLDSRLLTEDLPTGILPMIELARLFDVKVPLMNAVFEICQALLDRDLRQNGRTLYNLGLEGKSRQEILSILRT